MKNLIRLVSRIEPQLADYLDEECQHFFELIRSGQVSTQEEAMNAMYSGPRKRKKLSELKNRLIQQICRSVLSHPWQYSSPTQQAYIECWRNLASIKVLIAKDHGAKSLDIILATLRMARKYDLHRIVAELSQELHYHYYIIENHEAKGRKYRKLMEQEKLLASIEDEVKSRTTEALYLKNASRANTPELRKKLSMLCEQFAPYFKYQSVSINHHIWNVHIFLAYFQHDYQSVNDICQQAIQFMQERKIDRSFIFRYKLIPAQLILGQYDQARQNIKLAIAHIRKGEYSWSVFTYYRLLIELHDGQYQQAYHLYLAANSVHQVSRALKEQWKIVKGYMAFLIRNGRITLEGGGLPHYRKLIESVPLFAQDKQGNNINIIILQLLLNIGHNNDTLIDRAEAIKRYIDRHLRSRELIRARTFIEMMLKIPRYRFHYQAVMRHTASDLKRLRNRPLRLTQNQDIEIIPYVELWNIVLHILSKHSDRRLGRKRKLS